MLRIDETKICTKLPEVKRLIKYCKQTGYCSFDFETTTPDDQGSFADSTGFATIIGISFQPGARYVVPLGHYESPFKVIHKAVLKLISDELLQDEKIVKIAHNIKYEIKWLLSYGLPIPKGYILDSMLMKYVLDENSLNGLKPLTARFIPEYANYDDENKLLVKKHGWDMIPLEPLSKYCGTDTDMTLRLALLFERKLMEDQRLYDVYRNLYIPATFVLSEAEFTGMKIDSKILDKNIKIFKDHLDELDSKMRKHKVVAKFDKYRIRKAKKELIKELEEEIDEIKADQDEFEVGTKEWKSFQRRIENRYDKLTRYSAGEFSTKKELKAIEPLNLNSSKQMAELFFLSKKGFKFDIIKETDTGAPSTDKDTLLELFKRYDEPFLETLSEYSNYNKIYTSFLLGIKNKLSDNSSVHPSFLLHGTVTNRLSSREPNLQQIPRNYDPDSPNSVVKNMFICPKGKVLIHMDYSAAELRVLAGIANEKTMIKWFKEGRDFHLASACKKYKEDYDEILKIYKDEDHEEYPKWNMRRKQAKTINFGILYGQGPNKLSESLGDKKLGITVTPEEAVKFIEDFHKDFPKVSKWIKSQETFLEKNGFVRMPFGTKRRLPEVWSDNGGEVSRAKRQSINSPIQGTASNMTLFTSVMIREAILKGEITTSLQEVATVHDSLLFYINADEVHETVPKLFSFGEVKNLKEYFGFEWPSHLIQMKMDVEIGKSWGNLRGYNKDEDYVSWVN